MITTHIEQVHLSGNILAFIREILVSNVSLNTDYHTSEDCCVDRRDALYLATCYYGFAGTYCVKMEPADSSGKPISNHRPEDGVSRFLRNIGNEISDCAKSRGR